MISHKIVPNISVDCVVFGFDFEKLNVLLVERELKDEKSGKLLIKDHTLTGYHIFEDEDLGDKDKVWLKYINKGFAERIVTVGYLALIDNSKVTLHLKDKNVQWFPVNKINGMAMAFDHKYIFYKALDALQKKVKVEPIAFELLPDYFTLSQLQKLYEALLGISFDKRNFRKKVSQMHFVIPIKKKQKGVPHKPAQYYLFSREVYEKTRKGKISFII
jgi:8-oxo-dGTP diphosphatase